MDVHEPKVRSYNMSQIKGKDTKPEISILVKKTKDKRRKTQGKILFCNLA